MAIPVTLVGLSLSSVKLDTGARGVLLEGDSLLYLLLKFVVHGRLSPHHEVWLHPMAFAGWAGFFVTMMNLVPIGQLDGGHVAYALFGPRYDRASLWVVRALAALAALVALWVVATTPRAALDSAAFTPARLGLLGPRRPRDLSPLGQPAPADLGRSAVARAPTRRVALARVPRRPLHAPPASTGVSPPCAQPSAPAAPLCP